MTELERIGKAFDVPQICNPLMGGHTPILTMEEMAELGFNCAVLGLDTLMHAAKAVETVLLDMKSGQVRAAQRRHGFRGLQARRRLRQMGEHRRAVRSISSDRFRRRRRYASAGSRFAVFAGAGSFRPRMRRALS